MPAQNLTRDDTRQVPVRSHHQAAAEARRRVDGTAQSTCTEVDLHNLMPPGVHDASGAHSHVSYGPGLGLPRLLVSAAPSQQTLLHVDLLRIAHACHVQHIYVYMGSNVQLATKKLKP